LERPLALACGRGKWKKELEVGEGEADVARGGEGGMVSSTAWISGWRARQAVWRSLSSAVNQPTHTRELMQTRRGGGKAPEKKKDLRPTLIANSLTIPKSLLSPSCA
jgi:hypothetical protein